MGRTTAAALVSLPPHTQSGPTALPARQNVPCLGDCWFGHRRDDSRIQQYSGCSLPALFAAEGWAVWGCTPPRHPTTEYVWSWQ